MEPSTGKDPVLTSTANTPEPHPGKRILSIPVIALAAALLVAAPASESSAQEEGPATGPPAGDFPAAVPAPRNSDGSLPYRRPRVRYVIWYRQTWQPTTGWTTYGLAGGDPSSDHTNHVHLSIR
jgi:hypothetical protein